MIILMLVVILLLLLAGVVFLWFKVFRSDAKGFWKHIGALLLITPVLVAALAIVANVFSESNYENQKKAELLREVVASKDRPDVAFLTAVGDQLVLHLKRRDRILAREADQHTGAVVRTELVKAQAFEERAAYFFYGMFHSALIDLYASKGYEFYPRLWMKEAFYHLADRVNKLANGDQDEANPYTSEIEESALYKYFGAAAGTYKNITDRPGEPTKSAVLFDFNLMLDGVIRRPGPPQDQYQMPMEEELQKGCARFQTRLKDTRTAHELELAMATITALHDYAFNKLFAVWYQGPNSPREVNKLTDKIPGRICPTPPREYLFYPLHGWEGQNIREKTWQLIFASVSRKFQRREV